MSATHSDSDEDLALDAARGSRIAFEHLVLRYGGRVLSVLERRLGHYHEALDVSQDAWVRVFQALPRYRTGYSFRSWLFSIVLNGARDEWRRKHRSRLDYVDPLDCKATASAQAKPQESQDEAQAIEHAIQAVPEPYRTALVLVDVEGLSYEECAHALKIAEGTAKSRVFRGRRIFRESYLRHRMPPNQSVRAEVQP